MRIAIVDDLAAATGRTTAEILQLGAQGKITGKLEEPVDDPE